jgi:hypothetical protein
MLILAALVFALNLADAVPARWPSVDPKTLELLANTPVNTLLIDRAPASAAFAEQAAARGVAVLVVVRPGVDVAAAARSAVASKLAGIVLEGEFPPTAAQAARDVGLVAIELPPRSAIRFDAAAPVIGSYQGVWPGIRPQTKAAATGSAWIETNTGFLRFLRATTTAPVWIGNLPPPKTIVPAEAYLHAICDASVAGARWIVALDDGFSARLLAREPGALNDWRRIGVQLQFFEEHKEWRSWQPYSRLAVVQDAASGAMLSGGILDMLVTRHTPVRPVPVSKLTTEALEGAKWAVNVDPAALAPAQKEVLRAFTRAGGTLLNGSPGWKFPAPRGNQITLGEKELAQIDDIWAGMNSMIGRANLGVRLFNVSGTLSSLLGAPDGKRVVLQLVNYTNYPVESVTVQVLGRFTRARLYSPDKPARDLEVYPIEDGVGVDIPQAAVLAALVLE